jgi:hypothetical protein
MTRSGRYISVYSLPEGLQGHLASGFLTLNSRLYRSFFGAILNRALLGLVAGALVIDIATGGSPHALLWVLVQLLLLPALMAAEETLHLLVFLQKGFPSQALELVVLCRLTSRGRRLICYGAALRFPGPLGPRDRIHISAPGPVGSLLLAAILWSGISLYSGSLAGALTHHQFLPITLYLLSSLWPFRGVLPTDLANILRARKEGGYSLLKTLRACLASLALVWVSLRQVVGRG